jgi:hypothetical protein
MYGDDRFLASLRNHGDFAITLMNVEHAVAAIPLREDDFAFFVGVHASAPVSVSGCEEGFEIKNPFVLFHGTRPPKVEPLRAPNISPDLGTVQY